MSLRHLLRPRSVAIVGASDKIGPGLNAWNALRYVGFEGPVHLVNPNRPELLGQKTFPSLSAIPGEVEAVFIAIQAERVVEAVREAATKGAKGAAILSSGFAEADDNGKALQRALREAARAHGMSVCGPNCLGLLNFSGRAALFGTSLPAEVARGGVAAIVQSGSVGIALLNAARGLGLSHLITSGNEAVTTAADYLEFLVEEAEVTVVIAFLEQLREPKRFVAAARRARALGKPVIVLKSGRSARGQEAVMAHTGAVAGAVEVTDAAFAAAGVLQARSLDELIETAALVSTLKKPPARTGVAMLSLSGGEIALALDAADETGLSLPPVSSAKEEVTALLPAFANISNPLDLTWVGLYDPPVATRLAKALGSQDEIGVLALLQDAPRGLGEQQAARYSTLLRAVAEGARQAQKPLVAISNLSGEPHAGFSAVAAEEKVPYLRGTQEGMRALAAYAGWGSGREEPAPTLSGAEKARAAERLARLPRGRTPAEHEAREVLAAYGIRGPRETVAASADEAVAAAEKIGFPVVLKGISPGVVHKTEAGLVKIGLRSAADVREAATGMQGGAPVEKFLVQEMVRGVAELLVGARVDPEFGPVIVVGGGGVLVELYKDVAIRLAPVGAATAREMLAATRAAKLLGGWRGQPAGDAPAVAAAVAALSRFAADFSGEIAEVEINPLAVLAEGKGCVALDCVIVPARNAG